MCAPLVLGFKSHVGNAVGLVRLQWSGWEEVSCGRKENAGVAISKDAASVKTGSIRIRAGKSRGRVIALSPCGRGIPIHPTACRCRDTAHSTKLDKRKRQARHC